MKATAKFLTVLTLIIVSLVVYHAISRRLSISPDLRIQPASSNPELFQKIASDVENKTYEGLESLGPIENYSFVTLKAGIKNYSPFPAEWTQLELKSEIGDLVTVNADVGPKDIAPFKTGELSLTVLTESSEAYRSGWINYYIFGRPLTVDVLPEANGQQE